MSQSDPTLSPVSGPSRQALDPPYTLTGYAPTPTAEPPSPDCSPIRPPSTSASPPAPIPDTTLEQGSWRRFFRADSPHPRYSRMPFDLTNSSPEIDNEDAEPEERIQIFQRNVRRLQREANEDAGDESGPEGDDEEGLTDMSGSSAFATPTDFDSQVSAEPNSHGDGGRYDYDPITDTMVWVHPWNRGVVRDGGNDNNNANAPGGSTQPPRTNILLQLGESSRSRGEAGNALPATAPEHNLTRLNRDESGNALPTMTRDPSLPHSASMSTIIRTPSRRSKSLPIENPDDPSLPLGQRVWRLRSIRKRILSHIDHETAAAMCLVNKRMYSQCIPILARFVWVSDLSNEMLRSSVVGRPRRIFHSVKNLGLWRTDAIILLHVFHWFPSVDTLLFYDMQPDKSLQMFSCLTRVTKVNPGSGRTIVLSHAVHRNINEIVLLKPPVFHLEFPSEWHLVHRVGFNLDMPIFDTSPAANFTDFSPLGDRIWSVVTENPTPFAFAYQQIKRCVDKRSCQRTFIWGLVKLHLWRITLKELEALLQLLQAPHLKITELSIRTDVKDEGSLSTYDFTMAGPRLWRLFRVFDIISLDFRHDKYPLPLPGKGPKGLSAFTKNEQLNLSRINIFFDLLDDPVDEPMYMWKGGIEVFNWVCYAVGGPRSEVYRQIRYPPKTTLHQKLEREYECCDLGPFWQRVDQVSKAPDTAATLWEWEHGTLPSKKKKVSVGWSKFEPKRARASGTGMADAAPVVEGE